MNSQTDEPLSGQQIQQLGAKASAALQAAVDKIDARRFCLQLAASVCPNQPDKLLPLARTMHDFLMQPATQVNVTIERQVNPP